VNGLGIATLGLAREVTDVEVTSFRENGWVKLDGLLPAGTVAALLGRLQKKMGDSASRHRKVGKSTRTTQAAKMWRSFDYPSRDDEVFREVSVSAGLGRIGWRLLGCPVRFWVDSILVKLPAGQERNCNGLRTKQDTRSIAPRTSTVGSHANANTTAKPRWVYVVSLFDAESLYPGGKHWITDNQSEQLEV